MTEQNKRMKEYLIKNGIEAMPKYIKTGSMKGIWRIYNNKIKWYGNAELQNKMHSLGFRWIDGQRLGDSSGNGGNFHIFTICPTNKSLLIN